MSICSTAAPDPRKRILVTDEGVRPIFVPVLKAFKALGIGSTQGWGLVKQGKIKTVVRNGRRLAFVDSIEQLADEWLADESPPPRKGLAEATAASLASRRRGQNAPAAAATPGRVNAAGRRKWALMEPHIKEARLKRKRRPA